VPGDPFVLITSANGGTVYVSSNDQNVYAINTANDAIIATLPLGGTVTNAFARHPDGVRIYATQITGGTIKEIDTQSNTVLRTISIPATRLQGIAVSATAPSCTSRTRRRRCSGSSTSLPGHRSRR